VSDSVAERLSCQFVVADAVVLHSSTNRQQQMLCANRTLGWKVSAYHGICSDRSTHQIISIYSMTNVVFLYLL